MPVEHCQGNCYRSISISSIPGGNPMVLNEPENWVVEYAICSNCSSYYCLDCVKKPQHRCDPSFVEIKPAPKDDLINKKELKRAEFFSDLVSITDAIKMKINQEFDGAQLLRKLVEFQNWNVPMDDDLFDSIIIRNEATTPFHLDKGNKSHLLLFSDIEKHKTFKNATGDLTSGGNYLTKKGSSFFQMDLSAIDIVNIDAFSENAIHYKPAQFQVLKEMAESVEIEEKLRALQTGEGSTNSFIGDVRNYQNYILPMVNINGLESALPVVDDQGRKLISIFTADDIFEDYQSFYFESYCRNDVTKLPTGRKIDGVSLFQWITKLPNYDGFVINTNHKPIAFQSSTAQRFLSF